MWNFDGSSTGQSEGNYSDVFLKPVRLYKNPFRKHSLLVLCECYDDKDLRIPNISNRRKNLEEAMEKVKKAECWCGIEQEYVLYDVKKKKPY